VDQIIRDLVDNAIAQTKTLFVQKYREKLKKSVDSRILDLLTGDKGLTGTRKMFEEMLEKGKQLGELNIYISLSLSLSYTTTTTI
jgi:ATP-dependent protease HslVU (ClpYQ) ATPase subunit